MPPDRRAIQRSLYRPKHMKYRAILLFGAPGAGKGTQGKILGQIPNFIHFSCGDAFRNLRVDSQLGRVFIEYASQGQLVPDEPTIELWHGSIQGFIAAGRFNPEADTLLLDGIPRNPNQVRLMREMIDVKSIFNASSAAPCARTGSTTPMSRPSAPGSKPISGKPAPCWSATKKASSTKLTPPRSRCWCCSMSSRRSPAFPNPQ